MKRLVTLFLISLLIFISGCATLTPSDTYKKIVDHGKAQEWGMVYDGLSQSDQAYSDTSMEMMISYYNFEKDYSNLKGRDLFIEVMQALFAKDSNTVYNQAQYIEGSEKIHEDKATIRVKLEDREDEFHFVKEGKEWKLKLR